MTYSNSSISKDQWQNFKTTTTQGRDCISMRKPIPALFSGCLFLILYLVLCCTHLTTSAILTTLILTLLASVFRWGGGNEALICLFCCFAGATLLLRIKFKHTCLRKDNILRNFCQISKNFIIEENEKKRCYMSVNWQWHEWWCVLMNRCTVRTRLVRVNWPSCYETSKGELKSM